MKIWINGKEETVKENRCFSYEELAKICGRKPVPGLTVTWRYKSNAGGTLCAGDNIIAAEGMVFNVTDTSGA